MPTGNNSFLAEKPIKQLIWKFALPSIASQLAAYYLLRKFRTFRLSQSDFSLKFQNFKAISSLGILI